jgi:hypothetical protein
MKSAHFGFGADVLADEPPPLTIGDGPLTIGETPSVGLNRRGNVVMVYEASRGEKRYCVGHLDQATIQWGTTKPAGHGITPRVALNDKDIAVEVHRNAGHKTLYCRAGTLDRGNDAVAWPHARRYAEGANRTRPSVALNDAGVVVEVHEVHEGKKLWLEYAAGQVKETGGEHYVEWSAQRIRGAEGAMPAIAINNNNAVVEVHRFAYGNDARLFYSAGRATGTTIELRPRQLIRLPNNVTANGHYPSVAITDDGLVIVVLRARTKFEVIELVGQLSGDGNTITWSRWWYFDNGTRPSVAAAGAMAVEVHQHEQYRSLRFSTSIITDRASWMQDRLHTLGQKPLRDLVLPASHDAGMYHTLFDHARNQSLSIYEQLRYGIRYFDLRPMWRYQGSRSHFVIHHGRIVGPNLQTVLDDVRRFANEDRRELIILKFSHFQGVDSSLKYARLADQIIRTIGDWLVQPRPDDQRLADIPLSEFVKDRPAILVVVDGEFAIRDRRNGIWVYRNWGAPEEAARRDDLRVFDRWSNTENFEGMQNGQLGHFRDYNGRMQHGDRPCDLFLLSWTLTPRATAIPPWIPPTPLMLSRRANPALGAAIRFEDPPPNPPPPPQIPNAHGKIINLLYVDYVQGARVTDVALFQNGESV